MRRVTKDIRHDDGDGGLAGHRDGFNIQVIENYPKKGVLNPNLVMFKLNTGVLNGVCRCL